MHSHVGTLRKLQWFDSNWSTSLLRLLNIVSNAIAIKDSRITTYNLNLRAKLNIAASERPIVLVLIIAPLNYIPRTLVPHHRVYFKSPVFSSTSRNNLPLVTNIHTNPYIPHFLFFSFLSLSFLFKSRDDNLALPAPVNSLDRTLDVCFMLIGILDKSRFNYVLVYLRLAASRREKISRAPRFKLMTCITRVWWRRFHTLRAFLRCSICNSGVAIKARSLFFTMNLKAGFDLVP